MDTPTSPAMPPQTPAVEPAPQSSGSSKRTLWIVLGVILFLLIVGSVFSGWIIKKVFTSVGKSAIEYGIEKSTGGKADVDLSGGKVTVKGNDGGTVTYGVRNYPRTGQPTYPNIPVQKFSSPAPVIMSAVNQRLAVSLPPVTVLMLS